MSRYAQYVYSLLLHAYIPVTCRLCTVCDEYDTVTTAKFPYLA